MTASSVNHLTVEQAGAAGQVRNGTRVAENASRSQRQQTTPARAGVAGGWAHGPCEAWAFALGLARGGDLEKRMAMLAVDNAAELALKTYLSLHPRHRGGPTFPMDSDPKFAHLVDGFDECFPAWPPGISRGDLLWMHDVRNTLHHRGNGLTPDEGHLRRHLAGTEALLRFLFSDGPVDAALAEQQLGSGPQPSSESALPSIIVEVNAMIERVRLRASKMPRNAPPSTAVPPDVLELALRASEILGDAAINWDEDLRERMIEFNDWFWEADGVPPTPEATIGQLEKLRYELAVALL